MTTSRLDVIARLERRGDRLAALAECLRNRERSADTVRLLLGTQHFAEATDHVQHLGDLAAVRRVAACQAMNSRDFGTAVTRWSELALSGAAFDVRGLARALISSVRHEDAVRACEAFASPDATWEGAEPLVLAQVNARALTPLEAARKLEAMTGRADRSGSVRTSMGMVLEGAGEHRAALGAYLEAARLGETTVGGGAVRAAERLGDPSLAAPLLSSLLARPLDAEKRAATRASLARIRRSDASASELMRAIRVDSRFRSAWYWLALAVESTDPPLARDAAAIARGLGANEGRVEELASLSCPPVTFDALTEDVRRWESMGGGAVAYPLARARLERASDPRCKVLVARLAVERSDLETASRLLHETADVVLDRETASRRSMTAALAAATKGDFDALFEELERASERDPDDHTALLELALWNDRMHRHDEARAAYVRLGIMALALPAHVASTVALGIAMSDGNSLFASEIAHQALRRAPEDLRVRLDCADLALRYDDGPMRALEVLGTSPPDEAPERWYSLVLQAAGMAGGEDVAERLALEAATSVPSNVGFRRVAAIMYRRRGDAAHALAAALAAAELDPDSTEGWALVARLAKESGAHATAIDAVEKALSMSPLPQMEDDLLEMFVEARDDRRETDP